MVLECELGGGQQSQKNGRARWKAVFSSELGLILRPSALPEGISQRVLETTACPLASPYWSSRSHSVPVSHVIQQSLSFLSDSRLDTGREAQLSSLTLTALGGGFLYEGLQTSVCTLFRTH